MQNWFIDYRVQFQTQKIRLSHFICVSPLLPIGAGARIEEPKNREGNFNLVWEEPFSWSTSSCTVQD